MKKLLFISPPLHVKLNDTMTTGIVFMPFVLADAVGIARSLGFDTEVIDCFAALSKHKTVNELYGEMIIGITPPDILKFIESPAETYSDVFVFANHISNHRSVREICSVFFDASFRVHVIENAEAVTAYSLKAVEEELINAGVSKFFVRDVEAGFKDYLIQNTDKGKTSFESRYLNDKKLLFDDTNQGSYMPAWDLFPIENYWNLGFGHGPVTTDKYLPILTAKGCPFPCEFCVIPELTGRRWRFRTASGILADMKYLYQKFGVTEFHLEDVNPSINCERLVQLGRLIADSKYKDLFTWKLVSGTKLETIRTREFLATMASGGLDYVSFSPESGSERVRKSIGKPFNVDHSKRFLGWAKANSVCTQACFVLGFPAERFVDKLSSLLLVMKMTWWGVEEIAVFIITPIPGSSLHTKQEISGYESNDNFSFSPIWRDDYRQLIVTRIAMYLTFLVIKCIKNPISLLKSFVKIVLPVSSTVKLKMEMAPVRSNYFKGLKIRND